MRLLFACEFYYPSVGGVQEVIRQLAERLVERGHSVTVATSFLPDRKHLELNGVVIKQFKVSGNLSSGITGDAGSYRNYVLAGDYDLFMVKAAQQWTVDALLPVLDEITKPKVFIPCGFSGLYEPTFAEYFRAMPDVLRKFDHLVFYASNYRDINLAREHGISSYSIVPNGASEREFRVSADPGFRRRHGIGEEAFVILTVGSLTGQKGHREVAAAYELARLPSLESVLILNGNTPRPLATIRSLRVTASAIAHTFKTFGAIRAAKRVVRGVLIRLKMGWILTALGYQVADSVFAVVARINRSQTTKRAMIVNLPRDELIQAYMNSDLFVFASNIEYSPLVLYEAAAAGLPFLSVPVGNAAEIAEWTGAGAVCPASQDAQGYTRVDPVVLAQHITELASDAGRLAALGEAGQRAWSQKFTWEKITDRYEEIFVRLVTGRGRYEAGNPGIVTRSSSA